MENTGSAKNIRTGKNTEELAYFGQHPPYAPSSLGPGANCFLMFAPCFSPFPQRFGTGWEKLVIMGDQVAVVRSGRDR